VLSFALPIQAALKGAIEDLAVTAASAADTMADAADGLMKQPASPQQHARDIQLALLSNPTAGASVAKQHLQSSMSRLRSAVAAAAAFAASEESQKGVLEQQLQQLHVQLQQAEAAQQEQQGQVDGLQERLAAAVRDADAAKSQLQEVGAWLAAITLVAACP
jgi:chromosome segregation ATPase